MIYTYKQVLKNKLFFGNKINNLIRLFGGYNIPKGFIIDGMGNNNIILNNTKKYILRSSANIEDSDISSCAGLFNSKIINGNSNLDIEIRKLYDSIDFINIRKFLSRLGYNKEIKLSFLLQEFIYGDFSGVYFSNYNGEELLEYIKGPNSLLVDGLVNASSVNIIKNKLNVNLNKQEFYIGKNGERIFFNSFPRIKSSLLEYILKEFRKIKKEFDYEIDIEWTITGNKLYILQIRKIILK